ncbi:hydantoinase B/oxoprolinase family protein [Bremerella sp. P1]|uniref:hydantoinase B/oxoprolinase family protein n=1 Tax=Bremerella sp. P1 TaxID=3026424 RepID=UPI002367FE15|nr:hydantoinase B/oxoprolinase family protein [Bremerella sp. P1]WDI40977.1 hydantoinase B/oxoprolinase family protein [Bremerella sp. P1]
MRPEFWIDVGGTFTDCLLHLPGKSTRRKKVLSSGTTQGTVGPGSTQQVIIDPIRCNDPPNVWQGYQLELFDHHGERIESQMVTGFDHASGQLTLAAQLDKVPQSGSVYQLTGHEEAPLLSIRYLLGLSLSDPIPSVNVRLGTTRGTNALLTRTGADVGLIITEGFADILEIGSQSRPQLFNLDIKKPTSLVSQVIETRERLDAHGNTLTPLDEVDLKDKLSNLYASGVRSVAICFLHAYREPKHEIAARTIASEVGFTDVSVSHSVAPLIKIVSRGDTTVVDAYLNPILRDYVHKIQSKLGTGSQLRLLTSAGSLVAAESFSGKDSILSGPAGGVVGFAAAAKLAGFNKAIGFDMGGTSTDVSRFDGIYERQFETEKAGVRIVAPMMAIETVAAGGGSICAFDGVKLVVGPASAGADPGPACYGRGGPLTVTDINFALGKLKAARLPFPLDAEAVDRRLSEVCEQVEVATGQKRTPLELAAGFLQIANANIAEAIRTISVAKGYDPRSYLLVPFGGAAGQHACAVAEILGARQLLFHPSAGILSAVGIGAADTSRFATQPFYLALDEALPELPSSLEALKQTATAELNEEDVEQNSIIYQKQIELRYRGLEASLTIEAEPLASLGQRYHEEHRRRYGYERKEHPIEVVATRVEAISQGTTESVLSESQPPYEPAVVQTVPLVFQGKQIDTKVYDRDQLKPGARIVGPALIAESLATTVIDPGWKAEILSGGELLAGRTADQSTHDLQDSLTSLDSPDPVLLEILNKQFAAIAEQMGVALQNTSVSVNVKERLDFSCALFTSSGDLIANAPHIPVHLGAMAETVKATIEQHPNMKSGDVFVTNDPYHGGSHLPDVTVISPMFVHESDNQPTFFAASRAHHAEIGGIAAGSMPSGSKNLAEEGVLIENFRLIEAGTPRWEEFERILTEAPFPSRKVSDNLADIAAQIAANHHGIEDLKRMTQQYTLETVVAYAKHIQAAASRKTRAALAKIPPGRYEFADHLDDGSPLCVAIDLQGETATIDFTGTGPVLPGNLNANRAIVTAAVMYCLRCLLNEDIPLNQGVLEPVDIILPECFLNPPKKESPAKCAAVAGGNVETSQRVVDVLLGALGMAAASQGTMNNLTFGDATFGYYETICGGAGATRNAPGASAVHTHMTNTRLTDAEVFELRFPARIRRFAIRQGSGGPGHHRGGDGIIREIEFLRPLDVSLLTQRRGPYAPYGLNGGQPGQCGENLLHRVNAPETRLPNTASFSVDAGDILIVKTPGGGGFGRPDS